MKKINNRLGFTLAELLVSMIILGIITGLSIPVVRNIQKKQLEKKYTTYLDSLNYASKLYVDSYAEDLFGHSNKGCTYLTYDKLISHNLVKDIDIKDISCNTDYTLVKVVKFKEQYYYKSYMGCGSKKANTNNVNADVFRPNKIETSDICTSEFSKRISIKAIPETNLDIINKKVSPAVKLFSETGVQSGPDIQYGWSYAQGDDTVINGWHNIEFKIPKKKDQLKLIAKGETQIFPAITNVSTPAVTGDLWLVIKVNSLEDLDGDNWQDIRNDSDNYVYIGPYRVDNSAPLISDVEVKSAQTNYNSTNVKVTLKAEDEQYSDKNNLKVCISNKPCTASDYKKYRTSDTITVADDHDGGTYKVYISVKDAAGNTTSLAPIDYKVYKKCTDTKTDGNWVDTSACSKKCTGAGEEPGKKSQESGKLDKYLDNKCTGKMTREVKCNTMDCCSKTDMDCGAWSDETECSLKCGGGKKYQKRTCYKRSQYDNRVCEQDYSPDNTVREQSCNTMDCCSKTSEHQGEWSSWGGCTKACVEAGETAGTQKRTRTITVKSDYDGRTCSSRLEQQTRNCNGDITCCSSTSLSCGAWAAWSACSKTCEGTQSRNRTCNNVSVYDGRTCSANTLPANTTQSQACGATAAAATNCCAQTTENIGAWSAWSTCTKNCGGGTHERSRTITYKSAYNTSMTCSTKNETQTAGCNTDSCCKEEYQEKVYGSWSNWGACTKAGQCVAPGEDRGTKKRTRTVTLRSTKDGSTCSTYIETQTVECDEADVGTCCGAGNETVSCGAYGSWSACTKECKKSGESAGTHTHTRTCNNVSTIDGRVCSPNTDTAYTTQTQTCNDRLCCSSSTNTVSYSAWSAWGTCSSSCQGTQKRTRTATYKSAYITTLVCETKTETQTQACGANAEATNNCCSSTKLSCGSWGSWGSCQGTCGTGTQIRKRTCNNISTYDSRVCSANTIATNTTQSQTCTLATCCSQTVDNGTTYGSWSACPTCADSTVNQTRSKTVAKKSAYDGSTCPSVTTTESRACTGLPTCCSKKTKVCGSWGAYSSCSKTCGTGTQTRKRTCYYKSDYTGAKCGSDFTESESKNCNTQGCCSSTYTSCGSWGSYGSCSKSCGGGTKTRKRTCYRKSSYDNHNCSSYTDSSSTSCNTQGCCSSTYTTCGSWGGWSSCSKSCGGGTHKRYRTCYRKSNYTGSTCSSYTDSSSGSCNTRSCCSSTYCSYSYTYSSWSYWKKGICQRYKYKKCNKKSNYNGSSCGSYTVSSTRQSKSC